MPQKKTGRAGTCSGKTGRVYGALISLLTLMKSQPLAYNKDNQEDKEPLFDTVKTVQDCLRAFVDMLPISSPIERSCATLHSRGSLRRPIWQTIS